MTPLRVLLVDDEPPALRRLAALFADIDGAEVVGTAGNGREAEECLVSLRPDLIMLDISMPIKSGLRVAADMPAEQSPEIVFVTAFEQYAPDAFEVEAADYLLKPVRFDRLRQAVERARRRRTLAAAAERSAAVAEDRCFSDAVWVPAAGGHVRVPVAQIEWIEAARDYAMLHTAIRSYIVKTSMAALERKLDPSELMRVHRSTFLRPSIISSVQRLGRGLIALETRDKMVVQVGPSYVKSVLLRLGLE